MCVCARLSARSSLTHYPLSPINPLSFIKMKFIPDSQSHFIPLRYTSYRSELQPNIYSHFHSRFRGDFSLDFIAILRPAGNADVNWLEDFTIP